MYWREWKRDTGFMLIIHGMAAWAIFVLVGIGIAIWKAFAP